MAITPITSSGTSASVIDLSRLPPPDVVETLDFETIFAANLAWFTAAIEAAGGTFDATVESDPVVMLLQAVSYRELVLRQRVNDAARSVMVAYARGGDLDALGALFGVPRFTITPAGPPSVPVAIMESDDDYRRRIVLAPEGYSVAGPEGAYIFHASSASPDVLDAAVTSPEPGEVLVAILSRSGDGTPAPEVLAAVEARLNDDTIRPLTDLVTVVAADIVPFTVEASIAFMAGPDRAVVLQTARDRLDSYLAAARRLGRDVNRAGIIAALHPEGVQNVILAEPAADIVLTRLQAGYCTDITLTDAGVAE
jgi:phage-related baseplate assembly protein